MSDSRSEIKKVRLPYIDIAKGILILFLLYGHSTLFTRLMGLEDSSMDLWGKFVPWYNAFFMPAFFIITGYCSSYRSAFWGNLWNNIKILVLPTIAISFFCGYIGGIIWKGNFIPLNAFRGLKWLVEVGPWFIYALFLCKVFYWFLHSLNVKWKMVIIGAIYLAGLILDRLDLFPNYAYHRHAMLMLPYLAFGAWMKTKPEYIDKYLKPVALFGGISVTLQWLLMTFLWWPLPSHDLFIGVTIKTFPLHIVNCISGTAFIIYIAKRIGENSFLQTLGMGSLLLYLGNGFFQNIATKITYAILPSDTYMECLLIHLVAYLLCVAIGYAAVKIVYSTKYLSWIVGKW